jgi:glutamine synthetase
MASIQERIQRYKDEGVRRVKIAITDIDGVHRGKYISLDKFQAIAEGQAGFCDCVFGWDVTDTLYENAEFTGWHTAYPDALYKIDLSTERKIPGENVPFFLADFVSASGSGDHPVCPRNVLKRVLGRAQKQGFHANVAFEYEFFLFDETSHSIREKGYRNLKPLTPGMFGYSVLRNTTYGKLFNDFMDYCDDMGVPLEGLHCETGPGVWEAALAYDTALAAADKAALFKTFAKSFFQQRGITATFMARWSLDYPGQSGHIHQSLLNAQDENVFFDANKPNGISALMQHYIAGQVRYIREFLPLCAPTINSYTRLVKGFWAPTAATRGIENRTTALRVIPGSAKSQRVEFRVGSADANPYLAAAAVLGAGLLGIEQSLCLGEPVTGNAYAIQDAVPAAQQFPSNLADAVRHWRSSTVAEAVFGATFVDHFARSREWEVMAYEKAVTDWQLERYFEII